MLFLNLAPSRVSVGFEGVEAEPCVDFIASAAANQSILVGDGADPKKSAAWSRTAVLQYRIIVTNVFQQENCIMKIMHVQQLFIAVVSFEVSENNNYYQNSAQ